MAEPFPDRLLDALRGTGDSPADQLIAHLGNLAGDVGELLTLLESLIRINGIEDLDALDLPADEKAHVAAFLAASAELPAWYDEGRVEIGVRMFEKHTFLAFVVLGCASLPACYCWRFEAEVLATTGALIDEVPRRIPETAQMVLDVMARGGLARAQAGRAPGPGIRAAIKIRLIHACIRYLQSHHFPEVAADDFEAPRASYLWPYVRGFRALGDRIPINQEQLAATHLTFSFIMLRGYRDVGIRLTEGEQQAYMHAWNIIGYLLGMNAEILEKLGRVENASLLLDKIMQRNREASEPGKTLEFALLHFMRINIQRLSPLLFALGAGRWPKLITSCLIERATATAIGIEPGPLDRILRVPLWFGLRVLGELANMRLTQRLAERIFRWLSKRMWDWRTVDEVESDAAGLQLSGSRRPVIPASLSGRRVRDT